MPSNAVLQASRELNSLLTTSFQPLPWQAKLILDEEIRQIERYMHTIAEGNCDHPEAYWQNYPSPDFWYDEMDMICIYCGKPVDDDNYDKDGKLLTF